MGQGTRGPVGHKPHRPLPGEERSRVSKTQHITAFARQIGHRDFTDHVVESGLYRGHPMNEKWWPFVERHACLDEFALGH